MVGLQAMEPDFFLALAFAQWSQARFVPMKLFSLVLAIVATFSLSACCTGIVERKVPAKSCCSDGKCAVKHDH